MAPVLPQYDWIVAIVSIAFCFSAFGNGANDVANSFATVVAARTLTMAQAGVVSLFTEFGGAAILGARVTSTVKNDIIDIERFKSDPATFMVAMGSAEIAAAIWLVTATRLGFPVSTTHTTVGAIAGAGIGSVAAVTWAWEDGSMSQIAASWVISPLISACFSAILFSTLKFGVLERKNSFERALRAIPFYLAFTAAVLALFITVEAPGSPGLGALGAGVSCAIVLGVFFGALAISYIFFQPYLHRVVVLKDPRMRPWHIPLGPLLWKENPPVYLQGKSTMLIDHYSGQALQDSEAQSHQLSSPSDSAEASTDVRQPGQRTEIAQPSDKTAESKPTEGEATGFGDGDSPRQRPLEDVERQGATTRGIFSEHHSRWVEPEERFLAPTHHLPVYHPRRLWSFFLYIILQGVTRDCVNHDSPHLVKVHDKAPRYDNRIEHLWTYAQLLSAIMMSISHGSNDVANAVAPWLAVYEVYQTGEIGSDNPTPVWILAAAGLLLTVGFWVYGHYIVKSLGNKITQMSPTRGFAIELGAAITVLLASRLGLPVSTTQVVTGAVVGVSLMNLKLGATNWKQMAFIFFGWVLTLPVVGLIAGLLTLMALNAPSFG